MKHIKPEFNKPSPISYPWSVNHRDICPHNSTCPGFKTILSNKTPVTNYCHYRTCSFWPQLADCPCKDKHLCRGTDYLDGKPICNLREGRIIPPNKKLTKNKINKDIYLQPIVIVSD